jgi:hypothetical protein
MQEGHALISTTIPVFQNRTPGHFTHISITTPVVSALKN